MERYEIPDALPEDLAADGEGPERPQRSLLVPLLVVPALIVMVLALVSVLFGSIVGEERGPDENLDRVMNGSSNEREQALVLLVGQIHEHVTALQAGLEPEWEIRPAFLPEVERAWAETDPEDVRVRYVLAAIEATLGGGEGVPHLIELLGASDVLDPRGEVRFFTLVCLGALGPSFSSASQDAASTAVASFLTSEDSGLRNIAAAALQTLPGEATLPALHGALGDGQLKVRGSAAISLSYHGDPAGAGVLGELLDPGAYDRERERDPTLWARSADVSTSRGKAVQALARLGRPEDYQVLEAVASADPDLNVREAALRALAARQ